MALEQVYFTLRPQTCVSCWTTHKHMSQMCAGGLWQASSTTSGDYHLYSVTDSKILGLFIFGIALSLETWSTVSPLPLHDFWLWWPLLQRPFTVALLSVQAGQGALLYHFVQLLSICQPFVKSSRLTCSCLDSDPWRWDLASHFILWVNIMLSTG